MAIVVWSTADAEVIVLDKRARTRVTLSTAAAFRLAVHLALRGRNGRPCSLGPWGLPGVLSPSDALATAPAVFAHACKASLLFVETVGLPVDDGAEAAPDVVLDGDLRARFAV